MKRLAVGIVVAIVALVGVAAGVQYAARDDRGASTEGEARSLASAEPSSTDGASPDAPRASEECTLPKPARAVTRESQQQKEDPAPSTAPVANDPAASLPEATRPAADGAILVRIRPPRGTDAAIPLPPVRGAAEQQDYDVSFQPYGLGATSSGVKMVFVRITRCRADGDYDRPLDLAGSNLMVGLSSGVKVAVGGSYKGSLRLEPQGNQALAFLTSAKR